METVNAMRDAADKEAKFTTTLATNDPGICGTLEALRLELRAFAMMVEREAKWAREEEQ